MVTATRNCRPYILRGVNPFKQKQKPEKKKPVSKNKKQKIY
jgi:hypothetical protein